MPAPSPSITAAQAVRQPRGLFALAASEPLALLNSPLVPPLESFLQGLTQLDVRPPGVSSDLHYFMPSTRTVEVAQQRSIRIACDALTEAATAHRAALYSQAPAAGASLNSRAAADRVARLGSDLRALVEDFLSAERYRLCVEGVRSADAHIDADTSSTLMHPADARRRSH